MGLFDFLRPYHPQSSLTLSVTEHKALCVATCTWLFLFALPWLSDVLYGPTQDTNLWVIAGLRLRFAEVQL